MDSIEKLRLTPAPDRPGDGRRRAFGADVNGGFRAGRAFGEPMAAPGDHDAG